MKYKILITTLLVTMTFNIPFLARSVNELTKEQEKVKAEIDEVTDKIMDFEDDINSIQDKIDKNDEKISKLEDEQKKNEKNIESSRTGLDSSLEMMQKMHNTNMLATYFYDENELDNNYFLKLENINTLFDSVSGDMAKFIKKVDAIETDIQKINKLRDDNQTKLDKLNSTKKEQEDLEVSLKKELAKIEDKIGEAQITTTTTAIAPTDSSSSKSGTSDSSSKTPSTPANSSHSQLMAAAGISSSDYTYVNYIVSKESGWNYTAQNSMSGAYGLCQALPGAKMASAGGDWGTNPVTQLKWCNSYAVGRYGSWGSAYNFWISNHWW